MKESNLVEIKKPEQIEDMVGAHRSFIWAALLAGKPMYDHHRVHELYAQLRDMVHRKQKLRSRKIVKGEVNPSRIYLVIQMMKLRLDREITLKYKDANELLNALAEFRIVEHW